MTVHDDPGAVQRGPAIDVEAMSERVAGDTELVQRLLEHFLEKMDESVEAVCLAAEEPEGRRVERAAHKFRGAVVTVSAERMAVLLLNMEEAGRRGDVETARSFVEEFRTESVRVKAAVIEVLTTFS